MIILSFDDVAFPPFSFFNFSASNEQTPNLVEHSHKKDQHSYLSGIRLFSLHRLGTEAESFTRIIITLIKMVVAKVQLVGISAVSKFCVSLCKSTLCFSIEKILEIIRLER